MAKYKHIKNLFGYAVGSDGSVWSRRRRGYRGGLVSTYHRLNPHCCFGKTGQVTRLTVRLCRNGKYHSYAVHRLVLEAFVGPCPEGMEGCHEDGDPTNNDLTNLRWDTHKGNMLDSVKHGTSTKGIRSGRAKLTEDQVRLIRKLYATGNYIHRTLSNRFGIAMVTVSYIINRVIWKHI